jgi:hypothetical protein
MRVKVCHLHFVCPFVLSVSRYSTPSIAATNLTAAKCDFFANSLTTTLEDFANYMHKDNDQEPFVYGMWWTGRGTRGRMATGKPRKRGPRKWSLNHTADHDYNDGGELVIPEYGICIDFPRYVLLLHTNPNH